MASTRRADEIFYDALERTASSREAFLLEACGGDEALLAEVRSLLNAHAHAGDFLGIPAMGAAANTIRDTEDPTIGRQIGAFHVIRRVGSGGVGEVYLAERATEEFTQRVALKLIRRGVYDDDVLRRFRNECQVLAMLQHPNIARMIDGGFTAEGTPFIAMEYVDGMPIDRYCDEHDLSPRNRLDLFRTVCAAVQHAHRHSTIHRDIKPGNILVDRAGVVKLLDFGIARVFDAAEGGSYERTETHRQLLTPLYASPEQIRGDVLTTASDVYSLGVVLYKLLTGHVPYAVRTGSFQEMVRVLEDTSPTKPSEVFARRDSDGSTSTSIADSRRLSKVLRGDLDTIILMALRKETERRYPSVEQLSEDIRRYLRGMPVLAQVDTFGYRARKFARRNAVTVLAGVIVLVVLVGSAITGFTLYGRSQAARREAEQARDEAVRQRTAAEQVTTFLQELLSRADPMTGDTDLDLTVREALDDAAQRVNRELEDQPDVSGSLHHTIGLAYYNLGLFDEAQLHLDRSLAIREAVTPPDPDGVMGSLVTLGQLAWKKGAYDSAESLLVRAAEIGGSRSATNPTVMAECELALSRVMTERSKLDEASAYARRAARTAANIPDSRSRLHAQTVNEVGVVAYAMGRYVEAESVMTRAADIARETLGTGHALTGEYLNNLGVILHEEGRYAEAIPIFEQALDIYAVAYPPDHPEYTMTRMNIADAMQFNGDYEDAIALYRDVRDKFTAAFGPTHVNVAMATNNLAFALWQKRDLRAAKEEFEKAIGLLEACLGPTHPGLATSKNNFATVLRALGEPDAAERIAEDALDIMRANLPPDHPHLARPLATIAESRMDRGDFVGAEPLLTQAADLCDVGEETNPNWLRARILLGHCLTGQGRYGDAETLLLHAHAVLDSARSGDGETMKRALHRLVELYDAWGRPNDRARYEALLSESSTP